MHRSMMWALMGMTVTALVVAGCEDSNFFTDGGDNDGSSTVIVYNGIMGGDPVDVHIVPGAAGSEPDITNHTAQIKNMASGADSAPVIVGTGDLVVVFTRAGTNEVIARGYVNMAQGDAETAMLTNDASGDPVVDTH